jgi:hypothetical protein
MIGDNFNESLREAFLHLAVADFNQPGTTG